jgi:acetyltransferase-like isoleucine patch superfamily enzyme
MEMATPYCHGDAKRLHLGKRVSAVNTIFNVASGEIYVGDDTIFGHNCMVLTGRHEFVGGRRRRLVTGEPDTPTTGSDIRIGSGCWIASGAIVTGGVTIGDNSIIGAGAVVAMDVPSGVFAAGVPARVIKQLGSAEGGA